jgi:very-short-patch-repair endonuclease
VGSPIEAAFVDAYLDVASAFDVAVLSLCKAGRVNLHRDEWGQFQFYPRGKTTRESSELYQRGINHGKQWPSESYDAIVMSQALFNGYKLDFTITSALLPDFALCVELDGHDWHERTKQQASQDRARDRELLALGLPTMRFTGADVFRDANACAREVHAFFVGHHAHVDRWHQQIAVDGACDVLLEEHGGNTDAIDTAVPGWTDTARSSTSYQRQVKHRGKAWG